MEYYGLLKSKSADMKFYCLWIQHLYPIMLVLSQNLDDVDSEIDSIRMMSLLSRHDSAANYLTKCAQLVVHIYTSFQKQYQSMPMSDNSKG